MDHYHNAISIENDVIVLFFEQMHYTHQIQNEEAHSRDKSVYIL